MALRVVVDTNVWVSGLIMPDSPPGQVLQAIRERRIEPVISWEVAQELMEVMERPRLRRYGIARADVEAVLEIVRPFLPTVDVDVPVRDPADAPVIAAALAGNAPMIATGDRDLLADEQLTEWLAERGIEVVRPADLLTRLGP